MKELAVYIHVPFCRRKCAYCDFASFAGREGQWARYFEALNGEIEDWKETLRESNIRSVFFGGGTPSLVDARYIADVLAHLRDSAALAPDAEITLEANPGTLSGEKLAVYREAGINRLSIGVQSFDGDLLASLGRIHDPDTAVAAVLTAHEAGFDNISIDLMYALPGQTMKQWSDTLDAAAKLPLKHISAYSLIVEEGTEMARRVESGAAVVPDDDTVNEMQRLAVTRLETNGFRRYEVSNFAQAGYESRHNCAYWSDVDYLGLGSAAHSMVDNTRFHNPPDIGRYIAGERQLDRQERSIRDHKNEILMLSTRMVRGLELDRWRQLFREDLLETKTRELRKLENWGLVEVTDGYLRLTRPGLELQDSVVLELME